MKHYLIELADNERKVLTEIEFIKMNEELMKFDGIKPYRVIDTFFKKPEIGANELKYFIVEWENNDFDIISENEAKEILLSPKFSKTKTDDFLCFRSFFAHNCTQKENEQFMRDVAKLRQFQKLYFQEKNDKTKKQNYLKKSIELEKKVDDFLIDKMSE